MKRLPVIWMNLSTHTCDCTTSLQVLVASPHWSSAAFDAISAQGYGVDYGNTRAAAFMLAETQAFDLVVVNADFMGDQLAHFCRSIRYNSGDKATIVATAESPTLATRLKGYDLGIDTWTEQPAAAELLARLDVLHWRSGLTCALKLGTSSFQLKYNKRESEVTIDGHHLMLPPMAVRILSELIAAGPSGIHRELLSYNVWNSPARQGALRVIILIIRRQLARHPGLATIEAIDSGYRLLPG